MKVQIVKLHGHLFSLVQDNSQNPFNKSQSEVVLSIIHPLFLLRKFLFRLVDPHNTAVETRVYTYPLGLNHFPDLTGKEMVLQVLAISIILH